jgi:hypothetical protein
MWVKSQGSRVKGQETNVGHGLRAMAGDEHGV